MKNPTTVERQSGRELIVTRIFNDTLRRLFDAWARPELFQRWWAPQSFGLTILSYDADVRTGGTYRLVMAHPAAEQPMAFFGRYLDVVPLSRLAWTNDEGDAEGAVTTVTFTQQGDATCVVVHELYPSKEALDEAMASGSTSGWAEQFGQLDTFLGEQTTE